jgi:hypothetical protein|tara:strand:+ start:517 stop:669 length:153 start_codon:yes stop_codon:yes gene_type:complete
MSKGKKSKYPFFRDKGRSSATRKTSEGLGLRQDQSKEARDARRKAREAKK